MDGEIALDDARLLLTAYVGEWVHGDCGLTEEQIDLATITGIKKTWNYLEADYVPFSVTDCCMILRYVTASIAGVSVPDNVAEFYQLLINDELQGV